MTNNKPSPEEVAELLAAAAPFEQWYATLQKAFTTHNLWSGQNKKLVTATENKGTALHGWYSLKESFAATMPTWVCQWLQERHGHQPAIVLDPFLGSGTSGLTLGRSGMAVSGVEFNPFIHFVASTKAAVPQIDSDDLAVAIECITSRLVATSALPVPELSTLHNREYISEADLQTLLLALHLIPKVGASALSQAVLRLGVASAVDELFNLRKDGRALRYEVKARPWSVSETLSRIWDRMLREVLAYQTEHGRSAAPLFKVYHGSAVDLAAVEAPDGKPTKLADESFDTILYSPPYLNNFDYAEIYKIELWLLGFVHDQAAWRGLRLGALHSHPSLLHPISNNLALDPRMAEVASHLEVICQSECLARRSRKHIQQMIYGYFADMHLALQEQWRVLKPGGWLVYVVANSRQHYIPLATDVIIGEIAQRIGFTAHDLVILRRRNGRTRQKLFLHESAVFLQKPIA